MWAVSSSGRSEREHIGGGGKELRRGGGRSGVVILVPAWTDKSFAAAAASGGGSGSGDSTSTHALNELRIELKSELTTTRQAFETRMAKATSEIEAVKQQVDRLCAALIPATS